MTQNEPSTALLPLDQIQSCILLIRGQRVIMAADLARLYGVTVSRLNEQVKRNPDRFPEDFMFQLTLTEASSLRSQFATLKNYDLASGIRPSFRGAHSKYLPYAFTEHGAIMAATVLNSPQAVKASLFVVRAFVQLRQLLSTHHQLAAKIDELERKLQDHDQQILAIVDAIRQLMEQPDDPPKRRIGFHTELAPPESPPQARRSRRRVFQ